MSDDRMLSSARIRRAVATARTEITALIFVLSGASLSYWSNWLTGSDSPTPVQATLRDLGSLFVATGVITFAWELLSKRAFTEEVLAVAGVAESISRAGVSGVEQHYLSVDWKDLLLRSTQCDLMFVYARTWRNTYYQDLKRLVAAAETSLRVTLPDPEDDALMAMFARKFGETDSEIKGRVREAADYFVALSTLVGKGSSVEVRFTERVPAYSYYRFGGESVLVLYAVSRGRTDLPAITSVRSGFWHNFLVDQYDEVWAEAKAYQPATPS